MKKLLTSLFLISSLALSACDDSKSGACTPSATDLAITSTGDGISESYYSINTHRQLELCLVRGETYAFDFNNENIHPFIFTTDANGGDSADPLPAAQLPDYEDTSTYCHSGCTHDGETIKPDENTPDSFYYQCSAHPGLGAKITVIDGEPDDGKK